LCKAAINYLVNVNIAKAFSLGASIMRNSILAITLLAMTTMANAADINVTFEQPEKFTDIRPANETRSRFQDKVLQSFEGFFNEFATTLPEGYKWQVTVTDIDLAGDVDYFVGNAGQGLRIIKDIYSPAAQFNHTLVDEQGNEVLSGEVRLRDMGFMHHVNRVGQRKEFEFERRMLEDWFNKSVVSQVQSHTASISN